MEYIKLALLGGGILLMVIGIWFGIHYLLNPHVHKPDGKARITGSCGDTMEISLVFDGDRVAKTSYWTDGCTFSLNCLYAAAELAKGKTPDELLDIDADCLRDAIGDLPKDHLHCAQLAADSLMAALEDYMLKKDKRASVSDKYPEHSRPESRP